MIAARYKRWRHGRGFGVHSPFAYRFVTDILRRHRGYEYYASSRLDYLLRDYPRRTRRFCELLFRMAARLPIKSVCQLSDISALPAEVMKKANQRLHFTHSLPKHISAGLLIIIDAKAVDQSVLAALKADGIHLILRNLSQRKPLTTEIISQIKGGWTFESPESVIIITDSSIPLHRTTVNLP